MTGTLEAGGRDQVAGTLEAGDRDPDAGGKDPGYRCQGRVMFHHYFAWVSLSK